MMAFGSKEYHESNRLRSQAEQRVIDAVFLRITNQINTQNQKFSKIVEDHAVGVQRVYDEMQRLVARVVKLENYEGEVEEENEEDEEDEEIEIHACPFCGGAAECILLGIAANQIVCDDCGIKGPIHDTADLAADTWNNRV